MALALALLALLASFHGSSAVFPGDLVTDMTQFPFMAKFPPYNWNSSISCSATILSDRHVMLCAHCLNSTIRNSLGALGLGVFHDIDQILPGLKSEVYVGAPDIRSSDAIVHAVKAFALPPAYPFPIIPYVLENPLKWNKDMAIAELAVPLQFSANVQPIKLVKNFHPVRANQHRIAYMAGWGGSNIYNLANGTVKLEADEVCANATVTYYDYWRNQRGLGTTMDAAQLAEVAQNMSEALQQGGICASPKPSALEGGNGGGPLAVKVKGQFYQVGILVNTLAAGTAEDVFYTAKFVSTRVDVDCGWIVTVTGGMAQCVRLPNKREAVFKPPTGGGRKKREAVKPPTGGDGK